MNYFEQPMGKDSPDTIAPHFPEPVPNLFADYEKELHELSIRMAPLRNYIQAKNAFDQLQAEINNLMTDFHPNRKEFSAVRHLIKEKILLLQQYDAYIAEAEKNSAPEALIVETKEVLHELEKKQRQLEEIISVGKEYPELN